MVKGLDTFRKYFEKVELFCRSDFKLREISGAFGYCRNVMPSGYCLLQGGCIVGR